MSLPCLNKVIQSNPNKVIQSKLQHPFSPFPPPPPLPQANPGHVTVFCARGVGNLTSSCVGWGNLNRKCQVSNVFFFGLLKTTGADDDCSLVGYDRQIRRYGKAFEHHFARGRGNLNDPIFESSNARALLGGGGGGEGDVEVSS